VTFRYLLDTNVLSEPLRPEPDPGIMGHLRANRTEAATAAPVWNELVFGCRRLPPSARRRTLEQYVSETLAPALEVLPYDKAAADWHAAERARLGSAGRTPSFVDGQIAAIAHENGLVLVTRNTRDFADFQDLDVEDWSSSRSPRKSGASPSSR